MRSTVFSRKDFRTNHHLKNENSFFCHSNSGLRAVLAVPHQDDEILTACAMLRYLVMSGAEVSVIYTTRGDMKYPEKTRRREALRSLSLFGIEEKNIYFLGYDDSYFSMDHSHIFYNRDISSRYLDDLIKLLGRLSPDFIICTDFDEHPDHRMLTLYLDRAVGILHGEDPEFSPVVWKRFAYSLAYKAVSDFSAVNNPETRRPVAGKTGKYHWDFIDRFIYSWDQRIRIPVPEDFRDRDISRNFVSKALMMHRSQNIIVNAAGIINSDEVYWERRSDNLVSKSQITVSSGNSVPLSGYGLFEAEDIDSVIPVFSDFCWKPEDDDPEKKARFTWDKPVFVNRIVLYGALSEGSRIGRLSVTLNDGYEKIIDGLPSNAAPVVIIPDKNREIKYCELRILEYEGNDYGIIRCEIFKDAVPCRVVRPFCKLTINDNFVYDHFIDENQRECAIGIYTYGETGSISLSVIKGNASLRDSILVMDKEEKEAVIRGENADGSVYDQITVRRMDTKTSKAIQRAEISNRWFLMRKRQVQIIHNMSYILRHEGLISFGKRVVLFYIDKLREVFHDSDRK